MPTSDHPPTPSPSSSTPLSLEQVRLIARLLHEADLSEIEIETVSPHRDLSSTSSDTQASAPVVRLQLRRGSEPSIARRSPAPTAASAASPVGTSSTSTASPSTSGASQATSAGEWEVLSSAVGLFRALEPPLAVGDEVWAGQKAGAVEALKVPTDILFERAGRITQVLAEDNIGVEYAQPLFVVMSDG